MHGKQTMYVCAGRKYGATGNAVNFGAYTS